MKPGKSALAVLSVLTFINLFNYLDRYILVALSPSIKTDLQLSDLQVGLLTTAFIASYLLLSPLFGWLGDRQARFPLLSFGVGLWSLATAASGWTRSFGGLMTARLGVGVGEAAYGSISPAVLSDLYPPQNRGKMFSLFFMAIPVGSALGYLLGGLLEKWVGWRHAFFVVGLPGLLLAASVLCLQEPKRGAFDKEKPAVIPFGQALRDLLANHTYVLTVLGYAAYTFLVGGVAVWTPHFMVRYLGLQAADCSMLFGGITVVAGFVGTLVGGAWADKWNARSNDAYLKLSALSMFVVIPVFLLLLYVHSFWPFCIAVFVLEFFLFLSTSPINAQIVECVSPSMRATANAMAIFMIHILGDAISPSLTGYISDRTSLFWAMHLFFISILAAGVLWALKVVVYWEAMPWPKEALALPKSQCHRGYHFDGIQENTLEAFRVAETKGAKMVELDVHLSKDGEVVVVHDADIKRISGHDKKVKDCTAEELFRLAKIPTLAQVLSSITIAVNIEIKSTSAKTDGIEAAVARVVTEHKAQGRVLISTFNPLSLRRCSKVLPQVPRALLVGSEKSNANKFYLRKALLGFLARPHIINLDQALYTTAYARQLKARKVPVAVWTVEEPGLARKYLEMGADSIISPLPHIEA